MLDAVGGPVFLMLAFVIVIAAAMVVSLKNIFHCALCLIVCLSGVAGIYILLHAEFLAAVQLLIYVGAVSILIIFAIMLTSNLASRQIKQINQNAKAAFLVCCLFVFGIWAMLGRTVFLHFSNKPLPDNNIGTIGKLLMTDFMLPFEVVSVLMLAALIGAIVLAREERT
jgi:NADH:ubiquinone oxidoreductase subunit 6 (subunit J)